MGHPTSLAGDIIQTCSAWLPCAQSGQDEYQPDSFLLQQPLDILDSVFDILLPDSSIALALTCKALFQRYFANAEKRLRSSSSEEKRAVQLLLEKDIGHLQLFCHDCRIFHHFADDNRQELCRESAFVPHLDGYKLYSNTARLVMNRHLLGSPRGLPIESLDANIKAYSRKDDLTANLMWLQTWTAKIVDGELFLCATHVLDQQAQPGRMTAASLRAGFDSEVYQICTHQNLQVLSRRRKSPLDLQYGALDRDLFEPCQDVLQACNKCLTDSLTTIEWREVEAARSDSDSDAEPREDEAAGFWKITITAYHQLGNCGSDYDWKWLAADLFSHVTINMRGLMDEYMRQLPTHPPGSVQRAWERGQLPFWTRSTAKLAEQP